MGAQDIKAKYIGGSIREEIQNWSLGSHQQSKILGIMESPTASGVQTCLFHGVIVLEYSERESNRKGGNIARALICG
jgi:hypothetical protein